MSAEISFKKLGPELFVPLLDEDQAWADKVPILGIVKAKFRKERSSENHDRFFALLRIAYDLWEPAPIQYKGETLTPEKNFDEFRYWLIIKCGYYTVQGYPDGSVRVRAKSIAFGKMDEQEFRQLFSTAIDVVLQSVMSGFNYSHADLERDVLAFAG